LLRLKKLIEFIHLLNGMEYLEMSFLSFCKTIGISLLLSSLDITLFVLLSLSLQNDITSKGTWVAVCLSGFLILFRSWLYYHTYKVNFIWMYLSTMISFSMIVISSVINLENRFFVITIFGFIIKLCEIRYYLFVVYSCMKQVSPEPVQVEFNPNIITLHTPIECYICLEQVYEIIKLKCGHSLHTQCIQRWYAKGLHRTCPMCRETFDSIDIESAV